LQLGFVLDIEIQDKSIQPLVLSIPVKLGEKGQQTSSANPEEEQCEECIHPAYPEFKDLFKEYLSVTMSNTAPNVDADSYNEIN
jgi:hypothetical protein